MSYPIKLIKLITPIALAISLAACGGGEFGSKGVGGGNGVGNGGGTTVEVSSISLSANSQVGSDGATPLILKAIAKDGSTAIDGADISFSIYSDANATSTAGDAYIDNIKTVGSVVQADLNPGSKANRQLYIRAESGTKSSTVKAVSVVGTTVVINGPEAIGFGTTAGFILKLKDSGNQPIVGASVDLTSANGNISIISTTDVNGEIAFDYTASSGGNDTLTVSVLGASYNKIVAISPDEFTLSGNTSDIVINTPETINFEWKVSGAPQSAGEEILISATRGTVSNTKVTTGSAGAGKASFTITSDRAGETIITATSVSSGLSTSMTREFIATTPKYLNSQADPSLIPIDGSSTIIAKITDVDGNFVKGKTVTFNAAGGSGSLSASTAVTDSLGRASVSYSAGSSSSGENGVVITTSIQNDTTVPDDIIYLTVGGEATRIVLGFDHLISANGTQYQKDFSVFVTDNAGRPVKDKEVSVTIKPTHYYKGYMQTIDTDGDGEADKWAQNITAPECPSEDLNNNAHLDEFEDDNSNNRLEPTHDANINIDGSNKSDVNGLVKLKLVYPKNTALWSKQLITVSIQSEGTEFVESTSIILPILAADVGSVTNGVPNEASPYGFATLCTDPL